MNKIIKRVILSILLFYVIGSAIFEIAWMFGLNIFYPLRKIICSFWAQPGLCFLFGPLASEFVLQLVISWILSLSLCVFLLIPKKKIAIIASFIIIISAFLSWIFSQYIMGFTYAFSGLEKIPALARLYSKIIYLPNILTGLICHHDPYCGAFSPIFPFLIILLTFLVLVLPFFAFLFLPNKKIGATLGIIAYIIIAGLLFFPMLIYGNLYSENNSKPKMVYCMQNSYLTQLDSYENIKKDVSFDECIHDSIYWTIDRDGGLTNEKSAFDSDKVKKYCSNLPDKPLPDNIQKFSIVKSEDVFGKRNINFDGYKILTQRDFCFAAFAQKIWPAGEFSSDYPNYDYSDKTSQLKLCDNIPIENHRRDYCLYYAIIKKIADDKEKQNMCRMINNPDMENTCLRNYHIEERIEGNIEDNAGALNNFGYKESDLKNRILDPIALLAQGDAKKMSGKIILSKNVSATDGSAFFHGSLDKSNKDVLLNIQYRFVDIGAGDQFGIWIDDVMQFVSTGTVAGKDIKKAIINISKLNSGAHTLSLALHSYKNSIAPAKIEVESISILSSK